MEKNREIVYTRSNFGNMIISETTSFLANSEDLPEESEFLGLFEGKNKSSGSGSASSSSGSSISTNSSGGSGFWGALGSVFSGTLGLAATAAPTLVSVLPALGVGSKSRIKETQAQANAQTQILNAQALIDKEDDKRNKEMLALGGGLLLIMLVVIVALK